MSKEKEGIKRLKKGMTIKFNILSCLALIFLLSSCDSKHKNPTIEQKLLDVMKDTNVQVEEIIHLEVIKDGVLVFYTRDNSLYNAFIKLKGAQWEWYLGSGTLPIQTDQMLNSAFTNFDDFFIRYGVITDPKIRRVKDEESNDYARIIQNEDGLRIYFFVNKTVVFDSEKMRTRFHTLVPVYEN